MNWKDKSILITGISGFVGSALAEKLMGEGANVFGLVRKRAEGKSYRNLEQRRILDSVKLIDGDMADITSLAHAMDVVNPDYVFHLAAQSFVERSFANPVETAQINSMGTNNLLEAIRIKDASPRVVFAGSSEEYGFVFFSEKQYSEVLKKYSVVFPEPERIPELPMSEKNFLRPISPYAISKVFGEMIMRNYFHSYGIETLTPRFFNTEGAGRGPMFVTSVIAGQVMKTKFGETREIKIGNVNSCRDWSHIEDIINGYLLIAEKGKPGEPYNVGSTRTNSVLSYILMALEKTGVNIKSVQTKKGNIKISEPTEKTDAPLFGVKFERTRIDEMIINGELNFVPEHEGIEVHTDKGEFEIVFDKARFRPVDVPILMSDSSKVRKLGFTPKHSLSDIIRDQLNQHIENVNRARIE